MRGRGGCACVVWCSVAGVDVRVGIRSSVGGLGLVGLQVGFGGRPNLSASLFFNIFLFFLFFE